MSTICTKTRILAFTLVALLASSTANAADQGVRWQSDLEAAKRQAAQTGKLVLVHFWAPWCGPCVKLDNTVFSQASVAQTVDRGFVPVKLNADDFPTAARAFGVRSLPTDVILTPEGSVVATLATKEQRQLVKTPQGFIAELNRIAATRPGNSATTLAARSNQIPAVPVGYGSQYGGNQFAGQPGNPYNGAMQPPAGTPPVSNPYAALGQPVPMSQHQQVAAPTPNGATACHENACALPNGASTNGYLPNYAPQNYQPQNQTQQNNAPPSYQPSNNPRIPDFSYQPGAPSLQSNVSNSAPTPPLTTDTSPSSVADAGTGYQPSGTTTPQGAMAPTLGMNQTASDASQKSPYGSVPPSGAGQPNPYATGCSSTPSVPPNPYGRDGAPEQTTPLTTNQDSGSAMQAARPSMQTQNLAPGIASGTQNHYAGNAFADRNTAARAPFNPPAGPNAPAGQSAVPQGHPQLGLDGYCPVTLLNRNIPEKQRWRKGDPRWGAIHRGRTYLFTGPIEQQAFLADPDRYAPVLSGVDSVVALESGRSVHGSRRFGVVYNDQVFLFSSEDSLQRFAQNPARYAEGVRQAMRPVGGAVR